MSRHSSRKTPTLSDPSLREQLRYALRKAVNLEQRFGIREDARAEIEVAWDDAIDLLLRLKVS